MPQKYKFAFKKRIRAADNELQTRFFYNSECKNLISLHDRLKSKKKSCIYVESKGDISTVICHRKGKSSTSKIQNLQQVEISCTNRFASLADSCNSQQEGSDNVEKTSKCINKRNRIVGTSKKPEQKKISHV